MAVDPLRVNSETVSTQLVRVIVKCVSSSGVSTIKAMSTLYSASDSYTLK